MPFNKGQFVRVKAGQFDEETGVALSGWSGIILGGEDGMLEIEWDADTLAGMPASYVRNSEKNGFDHTRYWIEEDCVEAFTPLPLGDAKPLSQHLLSILGEVRGSGAFAASGASDFVPPGMQVEGLGDIGFPITPSQAKALIGIARQAPFGRGSKTVTDTSVRNTWEIDAGLVSILNPAWAKFLQKTLKTVKKELGIKKAEVTASFYKLLIYEKGGFFLPHKDSEKEKGMFGTLVIGLPSAHSGGELLIRFDGKEESIGFSQDAASYRIPYAAFYADCEHEVKPLQSGYRICLVYNLLQTDNQTPVNSPRLSGPVAETADLLRAMEPDFGPSPKAILLGHQYTPANFSLAGLKGQDRARAAVLMEAAEKAGYFTRLGLVTLYRMGELEGGDYNYGYGYDRRRYHYKQETSMGEVYEEYTKIEHWAADNPGPNLGELSIGEEDILSGEPLGEGDPVEKQEEGYTGNAGMTMEYWYHYGAIFLWPQKAHDGILHHLSVPAQMDWLDYYGRHWRDDDFSPEKHTRILLHSLPPKLPDAIRETWRVTTDFKQIAEALVRLRDEAFLQAKGIPLLEIIFQKMDAWQWPALLKVYGPEPFEPLFRKIAARASVPDLGCLLDALIALEKAGQKTFVSSLLQSLPPFLGKVKLYETTKSPFSSFMKETLSSQKEAASSIIKNLLSLSHYHEDHAEWMEQALQSLFKKHTRPYVNEVLVPLLRSGYPPSNKLAMALREAAVEDLRKRANAKPSPPADWSRKTPRSQYFQGIWDLLRPFLSSPTETTFDYVAVKADRERMVQAIRGETIDLSMETIRKGSPHTLRLTKTQAAFRLSMKEWEEDVKLLKTMENSAI